MSDELMEYTSQAGDKIQLSSETVKQYLVSGDANKVTDQEIKMFTELCKYQKLNPFLKEAYLIKYGTAPATIVTGKEAFLKRATANPIYRGHKTGIDDDGQTAWAEVYKEGFPFPIRVEVDLDEYIGRKGNGEVNAQWKSKPKTMLKKVALVQALRESFPDTLGSMYTEEEVVSSEPIDITPKETKTSTVKPAESKPAAEPSQSEDSDINAVRQELKDFLGMYCNGDEDEIAKTLKEISAFDKKPEGIVDIDKARSKKWLEGAIRNLKEKMNSENGLPEDCTENPDTCDIASWADGLAHCGDKSCPFQPEQKF